MKERLEEFVSSGLTAKFSCNNRDDFYSGRICATDERCFIAATINSRGYFSGIRLFFIKDLISIETDEDNLNRTVYLDKKVPKECEMLNLRSDLLKSLLNCVTSHSYAVTINAYGYDDIYGYIRKNDGNVIIADRYDGLGFYKGIVMVRSERILRISVFGPEETIVETLIKKRRMICT